MKFSLHYYSWFQKVMSVFIDIFFVAAPLASLYVLTSFLQGIMRYILFGAIVAIYLLIVFRFKDAIKEYLLKAVRWVDHLDKKKMILIITLTAIAMKAVFTFFFHYDATKSGDIQIYNDIAEQIIATGDIHSEAISHLYGLALHFVVFKLIGMPIHIGLFLAIYIGTLINFLSFEKILGKDRAFLMTMVYLLMPSTALLSFSPTHEVFVYLYVSIFLYFFSEMLHEEKTGKICADLLMMIFSCVLTCFVNPGGYILYIIMVLSVLLSNVSVKKKALIVLVLAVCVLCQNLISSYLQVNEFRTSLNTYYILIHGTNPESLGEQIDGYPLHEIRMYIHENTLDFSEAGFIDAARHVFVSQCIYLLKHPINLLRLIVHKIYILWSGVHYPIELAHVYEAMGDLVYYALLVINTLIYLFVVSIGFAYRKEREDEISISNYKLEFLGVIALTLVCIVVNKYSVYVTLFMYMISIYRSGLENE